MKKILFFVVVLWSGVVFATNLQLEASTQNDSLIESMISNITALFSSPQTLMQENVIMWLALVGLALVAVFALYIFSQRNTRIKKEYEKMESKQEEIIQMQNKILTNMSENIHHIAEEASKETKNIVLDASTKKKWKKL